MCYRDGIHRGWFDMLIARDIYRDWSIRCNIPFHASTVTRFINALVVMISPICPHWADSMLELISPGASINDTLWPAFTPYNRVIRKEYLMTHSM
jgi:leucyl-tRNA synthetase